jgi:alpha,alpha-trehalose phosphorylase
MWRDLGFFNKRRDGKFCIHGVTGPDEYNTVVDNNTFTNLMARENLWFAASTVRELQSEKPNRYAEVASETALGSSEVEEWQRAADMMYVPYDEELGIHPQDDAFLNREPWDFENTPPEKYPLLLHYHPLVIYRHQVIKQADVVLAMFLLGDEFTPEEKKRNYDFYDPLTTGDSSLSVSIQAIIAAELGYVDQAQDYARHALLMDLADVGGNVKDGCHIASMGGTWMAVVYGLAGFRDYDGRFTFRPRAPRKLGAVRFRMTLRGRLLEVAVGKEATTYTLLEGEELSLFHDDEEVRLSSKDSVVAKSHATTRNS